MIFVDADDVAALAETLVHPVRPSAVAVLYGEGRESNRIGTGTGKVKM